MSNTYYPLRKPFTNLIVGVKEYNIELYIKGSLSGVLDLWNESGLEAGITALIDFEFIDSGGFCGVLHTHWGGSEKKLVVTRGANLDENMVIVSQHLEITTVGEVLKRQGTGKLIFG